MGSNVMTSGAAPQGPSIDVLGRIRQAVKRRDEAALKHQSRRLSFALFAAALGPVAVLLLATQVVIFPNGGPLATGLIALELAALFFALAIGLLRMGPSHARWIRDRLRTEILRREEYLLRARVGPYLTTPDGALADRVEARLAGIDDDVKDPVVLLALEHKGTSWHDMLEDARRTRTTADVPDFPECLRVYLEERLVGQRQWFSKSSVAHRERARFLENGAKVVLTLALIVAALHLRGLLTAGDTHAAMLDEALIILAIALPAVGGAFVGLQSISGSHRLNRSYLYHAGALERLEQQLRRVQSQVNQSRIPPEDAQFEYKRVVLATEELLTAELRLWWLIMYPEIPKAAA